MTTEVFLEEKLKQTVKDTATRKSYGQGPPPVIVEPSYDPSDNGYYDGSGSTLGNAYVGMLLFIGADVMFFAGLIGAFIVFRFGALEWPSPEQPRLPIGVTGVNTAILLLSGYTMLRTWRILQNWNRLKVTKGLTFTAVLGLIFLIVQGFEWGRLLQFGLTLSSSIYGATFYVIIGCHALHVLGAIVWLMVVLFKLKYYPLAYTAEQHVGIKLAGMYWFLVVALWPILYMLVYLN